MINAENAIEVRDVTKNFKVFIDRGTTLKERTLFSKRRKHEYRQVLKGISFDVKRGEAIGLVGHNGCGKSTTLKLLTRILYPDTGSIEMCGRVSSLIELGAGFHPDLSGRENIYINAAIFGLTKKEIDARLDDIILFSELSEFIDNPVRTYSSGMYMRLAFSVAINVDADILLIDEILAVGDANFQAKCFSRLKEIKKKGTTIVIVSHNLGQIEQICERSIWIQDGLIREEGIPLEVHKSYLDYMGQKRQEILEEEERIRREREGLPAEDVTESQDNSQEDIIAANSEVNPEVNPEGGLNGEAQRDSDAESEEVDVHKPNGKRWGDKRAELTKISVLNVDGKRTAIFATGSDLRIRIHYKVHKKVENATFGIGIFRQDGVFCYGTNTLIEGLPHFDLTEDGVAEILLKNVPLIPNQYTLDVAIESDEGLPVDYYREVAQLEFYSSVADAGVARIEHEWKLS